MLRTCTLFCTLLCFSLALNAQELFFSEDFAGGLPPEWTPVKVLGNELPSANWQYTTVGPTGEFRTQALASETAGNGWMLFDSDLNCNINVGQDAWLISPAIDASNLNEVFLRFQTLYARFSDKVFIRVGTDTTDLQSWDSIDLFPDLTNNQFSDGSSINSGPQLNPQIVTADLTPFAAGESEVYFAFQFLSDASTQVGQAAFGCAYNWQIDDVELFDSEPVIANDLAITQYRFNADFLTPVAHLPDTVDLIMTLENQGAQTQSDITNEVVVINAQTNDTVHTSTQVLPSLGPDSSQVIVFDPFLPPKSPVGYIINYETSASGVEEENPGNNRISTGFITNDQDEFWKDDDVVLNATQPNMVANGQTWEIGNIYTIREEGWEATQGIFSVASNDDSHIGESINLFLYEVIPDDNPGITNEDLTAIGFATYNFDVQDTSFGLFEADLVDLETSEPGVALQADRSYILTVEYTPAMFAPFSELPYFYEVATLVNNGQWFDGGFGEETTAQIRLRVNNTSVSTRDVTLPESSLNIYPNPVGAQLQMAFDLEASTKLLQVQVFDLSGRQLASREYQNVQRQTLNLNTEQLPTGSYLLRARTGEGMITKRFVKQK